LTAVVGPNGGGKSNIIDAIAFTLMLRHISKKHKHLKELVYREEHERYLDNRREMWVQLNLAQGDKKLAVKRMINSQGRSEYFVNGLPMLVEDYVQKLASSDLNNLSLVNHFTIYQGKLEELFFNTSAAAGQSVEDSDKLVTMFEELSGSIDLKPQCLSLKQRLTACDDTIKTATEALQTLRLEKVKQRGL
jgi:chromosome segregation ATPase